MFLNYMTYTVKVGYLFIRDSLMLLQISLYRKVLNGYSKIIAKHFRELKWERKP